MSTPKEYWFEWKEMASKPVAINRRGKVVLFAPFAFFILFVISIPLTQNLESHPYWIMDGLFILFGVSFLYKVFALFTRTRSRKIIP